MERALTEHYDKRQDTMIKVNNCTLEVRAEQLNYYWCRHFRKTSRHN